MSFDFNKNIQINPNSWAADDLKLTEALYRPVLSQYGLDIKTIGQNAYKWVFTTNDHVPDTFYSNRMFQLFCELYQIDKELVCNQSFDIMDIFILMFPDLIINNNYTAIFTYPGINGVYDYSTPQTDSSTITIHNVNIEVVLAYIRFIAKNSQKYKADDLVNCYNVSFFDPDQKTHFKMGGSYKTNIELSKDDLVHLVLGLYYSCHLFTNVYLKQNVTYNTIIYNLKKYVKKLSQKEIYKLLDQYDINEAIETLYTMLCTYGLVTSEDDVKYKKMYSDGL